MSADLETRVSDLVRQRIRDGGFAGPIVSNNTKIFGDRVRTTIRPAAGQAWSDIVISALVSIIEIELKGDIKSVPGNNLRITFEWRPR